MSVSLALSSHVCLSLSSHVSLSLFTCLSLSLHMCLSLSVPSLRSPPLLISISVSSLRSFFLSSLPKLSFPFLLLSLLSLSVRKSLTCPESQSAQALAHSSVGELLASCTKNLYRCPVVCVCAQYVLSMCLVCA